MYSILKEIYEKIPNKEKNLNVKSNNSSFLPREEKCLPVRC